MIGPVSDFSDSFLGPENPQQCDYHTAQFVVIPAPLEATVSYGGGASMGPAAIIAASQQVEILDLETRTRPLDRGIATLKSLPRCDDPREFLDILRDTVYQVVLDKKIPITLGGEHTISLGPIEAISKQRKGKPFSILHFDAHADLRFSYQGTEYSHASVMRQILHRFPEVNVVQVGIRAVCEEEIEYIDKNPSRVKTFWAHEMKDWRIEDMLAPLLEDLYITVDVDGLDPSIMPATGTPEPGGLLYFQCLEIMRKAAEQRNVIGGDVNELAPLEGFHGCDLLAARLAYKLMAYSGLRRKNGTRSL
ncbi:MAG: agmatinase [Candidatus Cloacimonetes bacterium]|nr:agmatinase [Candidatus Cloacimonadota bacterium]